MLDGKKDMNGFKNRKKIGRESMKKRSPNSSHNLWNIKTKTIKVCICLVNHKQNKQ